MSRVPLTLACWDYDRTRPLRDGTVQVEGVDLNYLALPVEEIFWRMCQHEEFDASEMSLSAYLLYRTRPDPPFIAIPVFPSRMFRHAFVFVNARAGIERPEDLKGKRVGIPEWAMTAIVWLKGTFQHEYGVRPEDVEFRVGGLENPGRKERVDVSLPAGVKLTPIPEGRTLSEELDEGGIDALFTSRIPLCFRRGSPNVRRLFPDPKKVEMDYYRRTGIFPIMHTVVVKREIYRAHPWITQSLYKAFCEAKDLAASWLRDTQAIRYTLPWLLTEIEEEEAVLGKDLWPYGVEENRKTLEALLRYSVEQGLAEREVPIEELFAPNTLESFKV
ncbi:MAG: ABC transporter substrate-binding protein [Nitrospinota bacterium]